ncbi:MAG: DUF2986 domain-containing protein [Pseudomonadaceae bacterium]|nr:DUF2986 domain-containing protein [Pseudomonadaceae bacterium]
MNRRKKINQKLKSRAKKANAKLASPSKSQYISKANRPDLVVDSIQDVSCFFNE